MKKVLLLSLMVSFSIIALGQKSYTIKGNIEQVSAPAPDMAGWNEITTQSSVVNENFVRPVNPGVTKDVDLFKIGSSFNAYGYGYLGGQRSILWADNNLNTVAHIHRTSTDYSGHLDMDVSKTNGDNGTWDSDIRIYTATDNAGGTYYTDAARYPNAAIYNPPGNTDPDSAYYCYFAATLDKSNATDGWGGYGYGRASLGDYTDTIKNRHASHPADGYYHFIPEGFTTSSLGKAYMIDNNENWSGGTLVWENALHYWVGEWDDTEEDMVYTESLLDFPHVGAGRPLTPRVAFAPDGLTGYIICLDDIGDDAFSTTQSNVPVFMKTTDGGVTWSDPKSVPLGGPDGMYGVVQKLLTDVQIAEVFDAPVPARDEIVYTTAFDMDLVVDKNGNPHIAVVLGVKGSAAYSIITEEETFSAYDVFSTDGGNTWVAVRLAKLKQFQGSFGGLEENNRIQASVTHDGSKVFISWLDTKLDGADENNQPDIWVVGLDPDGTYTDSVNVTEFTAGWLVANFFCASHYVFEDGAGNYEIPFTFEEFTVPGDPTAPVNFMYVDNFIITDADFVNSWDPEFVVVVTDNIDAVYRFNVNQNYPNPFTGSTAIKVSLDKAADVSIDVYDLSGRIVYSIPAQRVSKEKEFIIDGSLLESGVYFYTVRAGEGVITQKMIVK